ncbi:hypothetical protein D3C85_1186340 [compost metagenome]
MLDVVAREDRQRSLGRKTVTQQALGNGADAGQHLGVTHPAPVAAVLASSDKRLLRAHLGPMHQAIQQAGRQLGQRFQGAHMQDALLFADLDRRTTDGYLPIARRTGFVLGWRSEFGTHVLVLHQGTPRLAEMRSTGAWQPATAALLLLCLACTRATIALKHSSPNGATAAQIG